MKPRRTRHTGNRIEIVVGDGGTHIKRVEREHRFAYELINVSRYHAREAKRAGADNYWRIRANVISAVTSSYAAIEASYNELVHLNALSAKSQLTEEKREVLHYIASEGLSPEPKQNTLQKFNMVLRVLEKEELNPNREPYQSANLIRLLRNMLVHPIPSTVITFDLADPDLSSQQDITKKLRSVLKLDRKATFPDGVLTPACAAWASRSAERFLHQFEKHSGVELGFVLQLD